MLESKGVKVTNLNFDNKNDVIDFLERFNEINEKSKLLRNIQEMKERCSFSYFKKIYSTRY